MQSSQPTREDWTSFAIFNTTATLITLFPHMRSLVRAIYTASELWLLLISVGIYSYIHILVVSFATDLDLCLGVN